MKKLLTTSAVALLSAATIPSANAVIAQNLNFATEWSDKPGGANYALPGGGKIHISPGPGITKNMKHVENLLKNQQVAQYAPPQSYVQYQPPSFFQGSSGAPVVVPPTVINTTPVAKDCKQKKIGLLFVFEVSSSDC